MQNHIAIVKNADSKVSKYQDFGSKSEADAHVEKYGGFVVDKPDSDRIDYWVVDADKKTVTYDKSTADSDDAALAAVAYKDVRREAYPDIADFADAYYWAQKGDDSKMTSYVAACAKVKADNPKP